MISAVPSMSLAVLAISVVLATTQFVVPVHSFNNPIVSHSPARPSERESYSRNTALQVFGFSAPEETTLDPQQDSSSFDRRSLLLAGAASLTAGFVVKDDNNPFQNRAPATLTTMEPSVEAGVIIAPTTSTVSSVQEALAMIESMGDKRFLHAVIASDYQFLYEESKTTKTPAASEIDVGGIFSQKVPTDSISGKRSVVLTAAGNLASSKAFSLWPLETAMCSSADTKGCDNGIHYAWPELGGSIRPTTDEATQNMIVDGIDCGKMSLEDALEGDMQVLVQAPSYLMVPKYMESNLRKGLQGAFLI